MFRSPWKNVRGPTGESDFPPSEVETAGYVSNEQRIINMMRAGETLREFREEFYDYGMEIDPDRHKVLRTRRKGYDFDDAYNDYHDLQEKAYQDFLSRKIAEEEKANASPTPPGPPPAEKEEQKDGA